MEYNWLKYSDAPDLPNQIVLEGINSSITKLNLHDEEATVCSRRLLLNPFQNRKSALLLMNGTVTKTMELSPTFYLFASDSRNRQELTLMDLQLC